MKHWIWILLICLGCYADISLQEAEILCKEADDFFAKGCDVALTDRVQAEENWKKAAVRLERAISEGHLANGPVFYNLGNIYFRLNDIGHAILNYRRAMRYTPNDINLQKNLAFARRRCQDTIEEQEKTRVMKTLFFWHYDLPLYLRDRLFVVAFSLLCLLGCLRLYLRRLWLTWSLSGACLLTLLLAGSIALTEWNEQHTCQGVIVAAAVEAHSGNNAAYEKCFDKPLHAGTDVLILEKRGAWFLIQLADGQSGWIPAKAIKEINQ